MFAMAFALFDDDPEYDDDDSIPTNSEINYFFSWCKTLLQSLYFFSESQTKEDTDLLKPLV